MPESMTRPEFERVLDMMHQHSNPEMGISVQAIKTEPEGQ